MSGGVRFTHADLDGDELEVSTGTLGAVLTAYDHHTGEQVSVAVRTDYLPTLIEALQRILKEAQA